MFHLALSFLFLLASPGLHSAQVRPSHTKTPVNILQAASEIHVEIADEEIVVHAPGKPPEAIMKELNKNLDPKPTPTALEKTLEPVGHAANWASRIIGVVVLGMALFGVLNR